MTARSFLTAVNRASRAVERSHRAHLRAQAAQARANIATARAAERELKLMEKAERERYVATRSAEVDQDNLHIADVERELSGLLHFSLQRSSSVVWVALRRKADEAALDYTPELVVGPVPSEAAFAPPQQAFWVKTLGIGKAKQATLEASGRQHYADALAAREAALERRRTALANLEKEVAHHNQELEQFCADVGSKKPDAIVHYAEMVLDASPYPEAFPQDFKIAYASDSHQIVVDYELPVLGDIIPDTEEYRYAKTSDKITSKKRTEKWRNSLYENTISRTTLRTLHELFSAEGLTHVDVIVFNGFVKTVNPATGQKVSPYLVSVRTTRDSFQSLELASVDPVVCLRSLNAAVSRSPRDLVPVKPIVEFDMMDPRFVAEQDILSGLDSRPNLLELTPGEFESLITNLFQKMGLETKLTQASRDGGVDCVAYDARPILGGKVVVQAKRYRHTVGVSAVRDLFGTMHNEGASKGILVTTSGFGPTAFTFANGKPIELVTGANLLYLLKEHANIDAKIEIPPDWVDPKFDVADPL